MARRATRFLASTSDLVLMDLVVAECVDLLESFYGVKRLRVAASMRAAVTMPTVNANKDLVLRALELYEDEHLDFADAYLVATAEASGLVGVASFDKAIDRVGFVDRIAP